MAKGPAVAIRKSTRTRNAPQRLTPNSDLPTDIQNMIHDAAQSTAAKSDVPFAPEAVTMLEQALCVPPPTLARASPRETASLTNRLFLSLREPIFRNMMEAAMKNAVENGRDTITDKDLDVIRKRIRQ